MYGQNDKLEVSEPLEIALEIYSNRQHDIGWPAIPTCLQLRILYKIIVCHI